ncbi:MAG TPA: glycosyltransferase family 39 protein, partial [Pyrinomonadaceae bacterium]|nr:glycosyltransferase family 39 protein [Pyrinomonadaceae bacterium]
MQRLTLAKRAWLLFFFAAVVLYFYGLGRLPLVGPDEPRYTQVAREMFMRADPVTPTLGGHAWFEKPPLLYWMMMASFSLFGVSEWSARFGPACSGLLTVLIVYWMGRHVRLTDETESQDGLGLWSSAALVTSAGLIVFSRGASLDIVLTLTLTAALACFFVSEVEADEKRRHWLFAGFYAGLGLSLLAKGLVGMILPFGVVATYFMLRRQRPGRSAWISAAWGIPLALLVAAVWYAPMIARHGWAFIDEFFIQHHFARYVSNKYHHPQPIYFYIPVIMTLCLPWTVFFLTALGGAKRWNWRAPTPAGKLRVFAIAWLIVPIVFFSFSESKLPGYILPALPGAAL